MHHRWMTDEWKIDLHELIVSDSGKLMEFLIETDPVRWRDMEDAPVADETDILIKTGCSVIHVRIGHWQEEIPHEKYPIPAQWVDRGGFKLHPVAWMPMPI